ncbi:hypothetical protein P168DRAFT_106646 [Aspergillus campestris IBT 28561]|uniref:Uncharacterized protein n=1 Tax=Aspergillus campestris (strain IBT 28561) TaxID=1392248 RepID=A0A2I1D8P7_ASPC2|nr:uncharacterized protein P168DRAFT_106646 [Aspergillus campestris IBT 28561]PKY06244.1 hypothetical protein P168DRAFT_106646 [Aspergillus campestris IBT 28561]
MEPPPWTPPPPSPLPDHHSPRPSINHVRPISISFLNLLLSFTLLCNCSSSSLTACRSKTFRIAWLAKYGSSVPLIELPGSQPPSAIDSHRLHDHHFLLDYLPLS